MSRHKADTKLRINPLLTESEWLLREQSIHNFEATSYMCHGKSSNKWRRQAFYGDASRWLLNVFHRPVIYTTCEVLSYQHGIYSVYFSTYTKLTLQCFWFSSGPFCCMHVLCLMAFLLVVTYIIQPTAPTYTHSWLKRTYGRVSTVPTATIITINVLSLPQVLQASTSSSSLLAPVPPQQLPPGTDIIYTWATSL